MWSKLSQGAFKYLLDLRRNKSKGEIINYGNNFQLKNWQYNKYIFFVKYSVKNKMSPVQTNTLEYYNECDVMEVYKVMKNKIKKNYISQFFFENKASEACF